MVCLFLVWKYDFQGDTRNKNFWYRGLLVWFIALSGFQYCVGVDIPRYMEEFQSLSKQFNVDVISNMTDGSKRQPGWLFLSWVCRLFTDNFLFFKIVQAVFFNVAVFSFFKRESKYVFLCVFFYAVSDYLVINFNVLRQGFSIAFGLYAISYLKNRQYIKYALCVLLAYMFHNSALALLISLIVPFMKFNKATLWISLGTFAIVFFVLRGSAMDTILYELTSNSAIEGDSVDMLVGYMDSEKLGVRQGAKITIRFIIALFVVVYCVVKRKDSFWGSFGLLYLLFLLITTMMPILWRFRLYFDFPYYIMLASFVSETPLQRFQSFRHVFYIVAIILFMYFPIKHYFKMNADNRHRYIDQYYPYHSVFDPKLEERI